MSNYFGQKFHSLFNVFTLSLKKKIFLQENKDDIFVTPHLERVYSTYNCRGAYVHQVSHWSILEDEIVK